LEHYTKLKITFNIFKTNRSLVGMGITTCVLQRGLATLQALSCIAAAVVAISALPPVLLSLRFFYSFFFYTFSFTLYFRCFCLRTFVPCVLYSFSLFFNYFFLFPFRFFQIPLLRGIVVFRCGQNVFLHLLGYYAA
jgi:hypothetical protein